MPVIQLPTDTRWGDLGKGLGAIAGAALTAYNDKQTAAGVAQIMSDPSIAEDQKPIQALKKHGDAGYKLYNDMLKGKLLQGQLTDVLAKSKLTDVTRQLEEQKLPFEAQLAKGKAAAAEAQPGLITAETADKNATAARTTALTQPEVEGRQAATAKLQAEVPGEKAASELAQIKVDQIKKSLDESANPVSTGNLDKFMDAAGITNPQVRAIAKGQYDAEPDPMKKKEAFVKSLQTQTGSDRAAVTRAGTPTALPSDERKLTGASAQFATSMKQFVDVASKSPEEMGLLTGAGIRGWLEKHGIATGDENLLKLVENQAQLVQSASTSGGGFFSAGRVTLAREAMPSVNRTALANIIAIDTVADRQIVELERQKSAFAGTPTVTKPIDDTIAQWREIKSTTGSLQSYMAPAKSGRPEDAKPVMLFNGDQVDSKSFKPIVKGREEYTFKGGAHLPGAEIISRAQKAQMAPDAYLAYIKAYYEK